MFSGLYLIGDEDIGASKTKMFTFQSPSTFPWSLTSFPPSCFFLKSRSERFKLRNPQRATGHAVAGAELCSGEQVAALTDLAGKVQHLKLFSKKFQHYYVNSTYWINCLHNNNRQKQYIRNDLLQIVCLDRPVAKSCTEQQIAKYWFDLSWITSCKRSCPGRQVAQRW